MYSLETPNLRLPQFQPNDHPDFLTDFNNAFEKLDKAVTEIRNDLTNINNQITDIQARLSMLESARRLKGE